MLHIEVEDPVVVQRHEGLLTPATSTHHYCTLGLTPKGTAILFYAMHPDIRRPDRGRRPETVGDSKYPVYKFRPLESDPDYPWPHEVVYCRSEDGGRSWTDPLPIDGRGCVPVGEKLLSFCHFLYLDRPGVAVASLLESDDDGRTWRDRPGVLFHYPADLELLYNERHLDGPPVVLNFENACTPLALSDGSVITFATAHRRVAGKEWWFPLLFRSTDGGFSFEFVSFPAGQDCPDNHHGYTEPALVELANGDLLATFRIEYHDPDRVMMQCVSSDGGQTWTDPVICTGVPRHYPLRALEPIRNEGKTHGNAANVSPDMAVMPSGIVAMVYGRPGVHITFSEEGDGSVWRDRLPVVPEPSLFGRNCGSSAMAGVVALGGDHVLMVYDVHNYEPPGGGLPGNTVLALSLKVKRVATD